MGDERAYQATREGRSPRQSPPFHCEREIGCINLAEAAAGTGQASVHHKSASEPNRGSGSRVVAAKRSRASHARLEKREHRLPLTSICGREGELKMANLGNGMSPWREP
jgi:hypothetical protein